ncbi:histidine phosphatase family protein [Candidatus Gracilibacteria bacterium]|nr:histidine phosphatase family protein [Candidatus Gracilibacteria bacterium]
MALYFVRHGQTQNNLENRMNTGDDNDPLTEVGKSQAVQAGIDLKANEKININVIISSNLNRAKETAKIIAEQIGYDGKIYQDTRLREQDGGIFKGKKRDEIKSEYNLNSDYEFRKLFKNRENNKKEDVTDFDQRVGEFLQDMNINFSNANILLVGHSGTSRALLRNVQDLDFETTHFEMPGVKNAQVINLETYGIV